MGFVDVLPLLQCLLLIQKSVRFCQFYPSSLGVLNHILGKLIGTQAGIISDFKWPLGLSISEEQSINNQDLEDIPLIYF